MRYLKFIFLIGIRVLMKYDNPVTLQVLRRRIECILYLSSEVYAYYSYIRLVYSLDARGGPLSQASHLAVTDDLGSRTYFLTDGASTRARLRINNVQREDEGVFRCRVDFTNSPTRNFKVNLTLVGQISVNVVPQTNTNTNPNIACR